jgi:hypothetical protein
MWPASDLAQYQESLHSPSSHLTEGHSQPEYPLSRSQVNLPDHHKRVPDLFSEILIQFFCVMKFKNQQHKEKRATTL